MGKRGGTLLHLQHRQLLATDDWAEIRLRSLESRSGFNKFLQVTISKVTLVVMMNSRHNLCLQGRRAARNKVLCLMILQFYIFRPP